jgi:peptidase E
LVAKLHQTGLMGVIAERVNAGVPFIGWSAGKLRLNQMDG